MFYVYAYKDPRPTKNQQVVYVGKGTGRRAWYHWEKRAQKNSGFGNFLAHLRRLELEPIIEIIKDNLDEAEAFVEEIRLIVEYGRRDLKTGTLFNLTDGGEGFSGIVRTEEWKAAISKALSIEEVKNKQSAAKVADWANPEYKERMRKVMREVLADPEKRKRWSKLGGIHQTEEFCQTMATATTKMWEDSEYVEKVVAGQIAAQNTPEAHAKKSANSKLLWKKQGVELAGKIKAARNTPSSKAKTRAQAKAQWADPTYAAKQTANNQEIANRAEVKAAKATAAKALWADPIWKAKMLAARANKKLDRNNK